MENRPSLVSETGQDLKEAVAQQKNLVDSEGQEIASGPGAAPTTKDFGKNLATVWLNNASSQPTNEGVNKHLDVLYHAARNIIAHRIANIALGFGEKETTVTNWDASRCLTAEQDAQSDIEETVQEWKQDFFNGELAYHHEKKS